MNEELIGFVEWLSKNTDDFIGLTVEETVSKINDMLESSSGKEELRQLTKQYKGMELFKKGGKLDYLLCLKKGGKVQDCGCGKKIEKAATGSSGVADGDWDDYHTIINAPGDTLRFKQYFSGPAYMRTHPEGGVTYERSTRDGVTRMYDENYQPSWYEVNILGMTPVTADEKENWKQLIKNHANDTTVKDKTKKSGILEWFGIKRNQPGGVIDSNRLVTWTEPESKGGTYNAIYNDEQGNGKYAYTSYPGQGYSLKSGTETYVSDGFNAFDVSDSTRYRPISEAPQDTLNWLRQIEQLRKQK